MLWFGKARQTASTPTTRDAQVAQDPELVALAASPEPVLDVDESEADADATYQPPEGGLVCPECGQDNWPEQAFCLACGVYLRGEARQRRRTRRPWTAVAILLIAVGSAAMAYRAYRFQREKRDWPELTVPEVAEPADAFAELGLPRHPQARETSTPIVARARDEDLAALEGATMKPYVISQGIDEVAEWYRTHLNAGWQEQEPSDGTPQGPLFRRENQDGSVTVLTLCPAMYGAGRAAPVANITGVLLVRLPPQQDDQ